MVHTAITQNSPVLRLPMLKPTTSRVGKRTGKRFSQRPKAMRAPLFAMERGNYSNSPVVDFNFQNGRAGGIRTRDLLNPIQAHYQAVLRPDTVNLRFHSPL